MLAPPFSGNCGWIIELDLLVGWNMEKRLLFVIGTWWLLYCDEVTVVDWRLLWILWHVEHEPDDDADERAADGRRRMTTGSVGIGSCGVLLADMKAAAPDEARRTAGAEAMTGE